MKTVIMWFRNDLRINDNPALMAAINDADYVIPIFIINDSIFSGIHASPNRNQFLVESLTDLNDSLNKISGGLVVLEGKTIELLKDLCKKYDVHSIYYAKDFSPYATKRDGAVDKEMTNIGVTTKIFPGRLVLPNIKDIKTQTGNIYQVFTPFYNQWLKTERRKVLESPKKINLPKNIDFGIKIEDIKIDKKKLSLNLVKGGETKALEILDKFLKINIQDYIKAHNDPSANKTSHLSPYLHFGCISPSYIESCLGASESELAWQRQLCWRDFYNYILANFPGNNKHEFQNKYRNIQWVSDETSLNAWKEGKTGYPIVDAAMRQLNTEGWMHNRSRLIVGSFLTKDLFIDWREGEKYFMEKLVDGDMANNNGNWQWIASVGTDPAPVARRIFNPSLQRQKFDPSGLYIRKYVPELKNVPLEFIDNPSLMSEELQREYNCIVGKDYPRPIVDHAVARIKALDNFKKSIALSNY